MRKIISIFILLSWFTLNAKNIISTIEFDKNDISFVEKEYNGIKYCKVEYKGGSSSKKSTIVIKPQKAFYFQVPINAKFKSVSIVSKEFYPQKTLPGIPYPVQEEVLSNADKNFVFTASSTIYTDSILGKIEINYCGDELYDGYVRLFKISVSPVTYSSNSVEDYIFTVNILKNITLKIEYDEDNINSDFQTIKPKYSTPYIKLKEIISNPKDEVNYPLMEEMPNDQRKYLILTPKKLIKSLKTLQNWKIQKGYKVDIKTFENIYADFPSKTKHESVRNYLKSYFRENGQSYLLIVGDWRLDVPFGRGINSVPTDNYFYDLFSNWTDERQYNYSSRDDVCYFPSFIVGRLLAENEDEIVSYTKKLIQYESGFKIPDLSYLDRAIYVEQLDMAENDEAKGVIKSWGNYFLNTEVISESDTNKPNGKNVIEAINNKQFGFISLHGHGNPTSIMTCRMQSGSGRGIICNDTINSVYTGISQKDTLNALNNINNNNFPAVVYTISCDVNPFDIYKGSISYDVKQNMGSSFTVGKGYGGVAWLGNTRYGIIHESAKMEEIFVDFIKKGYSVGMAESLSKMFYVCDLNMSRQIKECHTLIGEPEFFMWLKKPEKLNIKTSYTNEEIVFECDSLNGSILCRADGDFCLRKQIEGSRVTLLNPNGIVSFWKNNYLPHIKYFCYNNIPTGDSICRYVHEFYLGKSTLPPIVIEERASVEVNVFDKAYIENNIIKGYLDIKCDNEVIINGGTLKKGCKVIITSPKVTINKYFNVESGANLIINSK